MPAFPREELEEMVRRWVAANDDAGRSGDWSKMADFYTEDAVYTWNTSDKWEFVARRPSARSTTGPSAARWPASSAGPTPTFAP